LKNIAVTNFSDFMLLNVSCYWTECSERNKVYYGLSDFHSNAIHNRECTNLGMFIPVSSS